ncbi:cellulose-binding protein [Streptomyces wedmorensis]
MGFAVGRGRGYRPEQVDRHVAALSEERDGAWERAARLTVLAKEMEAEAARLRAAVEALAPQRYESLGDRARKILEMAEQEDEALVRAAEADAQALVAAAEAAGAEAAEAARAHAEGIRAAAETAARVTLEAARKQASELAADARRDTDEQRTAAREAYGETERRSADLLAAQRTEQAAVRDEADHEAETRATGLDARHDELVSRAEARLAEAQRALAETEERARHGQEDAEARAEELRAEARMKAERVERDTERLLREHDESRDEIHSHMEHIRNSLATLTGRSPSTDGPPTPEQPDEDEPLTESDDPEPAP